MTNPPDPGVSSSPPHLAVLDVLWRRGFPTVLAGRGAPLPAAIVWVDEPDDPPFHLLPRAFGGHLMLELRDHHGEPTPSFWLGVGRGPTLASLALARWRAAEGADGHAALLGTRAPQAWAAFEELCDALLRPARDAVPPAAPGAEELGAAAVSLGRLVEGALPISTHSASGLALALGSVLRSEERTSAAGALP